MFRAPQALLNDFGEVITLASDPLGPILFVLFILLAACEHAAETALPFLDESGWEKSAGQGDSRSRRMLRLAELRILAAEAGINRIEVKDGVARLFRRDGTPWLTAAGKLPRLTGKTTDAKLTALFHVVGAVRGK